MVKADYKQTEIGVIPEDWDIVLLGDFVNKVGSGITPTGGAKVYKSSGRPFVRSQNVGWGRLKLDDLAFIDEETHQSFVSSEIQKDDVLLNITGASIGRSSIADERIALGNVNQHVCIIRTKQNELNPQFLNLFLLSIDGQKQIDSFQAGGNRQGLNFGQIRSFKIKKPMLLEEQRAIAEALSDVDALIAGLDKLIAKKRAIKTATMQQLLTGKKRLPGFGGNGRWETKQIDEIAEISMGRTPSRQNGAYWGKGHKWLSIRDMKSKWICDSREEITDLAVSDMKAIPQGTLMMSFKLSIGRLAFAGCDLYTNEAICSFNQLQANAEFLYYILGETDFSLYGKQAVKGYTLNKDSLNTVKIPFPSLDEQTAIASVLSDIDNEITALETRRAKTQAIKQGMMQELLTGRTRLL